LRGEQATADPYGMTNKGQATTKAKCGGLSTAAAKCACPFDCAQGRDDVLFRLGGKEQTTANAGILPHSTVLRVEMTFVED
jgi:hypothetical protein